MIDYKETLFISGGRAEMIKDALNNAILSEDETLVETVTFEDGIEMDIKVCGADGDTAWTEAVLFKDGAEIGCTEPGEVFFGLWVLSYNGKSYVVDVKESKNTRTAKFNVSCLATYRSELEIPEEIPEGEELAYIQAHLHECKVNDLTHLNDLAPEEAVTEEDILYIEGSDEISSTGEPA